MKSTEEDKLPKNIINIGDTEMQKDQEPISLHPNPAHKKVTSSSLDLVGLSTSDDVEAVNSSVEWLQGTSPVVY